MLMKLLVIAAAVGAVFASPWHLSDCHNRCSEEKTLSEACQRGCGFYSIRKAEVGQLQGKSVLEKCNKDCGVAYAEAEGTVCRKGCGYQAESGPEADDNVGSLSVSFGSLPRVFDLSDVFGDILGKQDDGFRNWLGDGSGKKGSEEEGGLSSFFSSVHNSMREMMKGMMSRPMFGKPDASDGDTSMPLKHAGGELVVIKSGPGYHEEKTYHLGPNTNIDKIMQSSMNDMMAFKNPMEKSNQQNDIEVFEPINVLKGGDSEIKANDLFDTDPWGFIRRPAAEEPTLPDTPLRSHHVVVNQQETGPNVRRYTFVGRSLCPQYSKSMTWSDWFSCLHVRMGLPTWLLAASVALGVLFTLWLCMVIPSSAPKQKVKKAKMMIGTKEEEATLGISTVITGGSIPRKLDMPPSYDDVAKQVEPVHEFKAKVDLDNDVAAGPLPEKKDGGDPSA